MQLNFNRPFTKKTSIKRKIFSFFLYFIALFLALFLLSKFNFPAPMEKIKNNITNETIKLK